MPWGLIGSVFAMLRMWVMWVMRLADQRNCRHCYVYLSASRRASLGTAPASTSVPRSATNQRRGYSCKFAMLRMWVMHRLHQSIECQRGHSNRSWIECHRGHPTRSCTECQRGHSNSALNAKEVIHVAQIFLFFQRGHCSDLPILHVSRRQRRFRSQV